MTKAILKDTVRAFFKTYPILRRTIYAAFDTHPEKLTRTQQAVLVAMMSGNIFNMTEISRSINTSNEQATRAIAQLVEKGYISRSQNIENRRVINITLTASAKKLLDEVVDIASESLITQFKGLNTPEARKYIESVNIVERILNFKD